MGATNRPAAGRMTGGEAVVAALAAHGVDTAFGIPGTHNLGIYAHLPSYGIRHALPRHEQGAAFAADGYARVTGRPGVVLTTTGPGALNAATGLAQSYSDSVPVLLVSPGEPLDHPAHGNGMLHEVKDQSAALAAVCAASNRVRSVAEIPVAVAQEFAALRGGRPRPRHLEIPLDLVDAAAEVRPAAPVPVPAVRPDPAVVAEAVRVLAEARRPGVVVGGGARAAAAELGELVRLLGAPTATTANGKGVLAEDDPLALGAGLHHPAVREFLADCDAVLAVGTELAPADTWDQPLHPGGPLVRIDVDPVQAVTNAEPDVVVVADAACALRELAGALPGAPPPGADRAARWRRRIAAQARDQGERYLPVLEPIAAVLGRDGILAADSAKVCYYGALSNLPRYRPGGFLYPSGLGTLGYGLPAAIGAKLARPDVPVIALHGDGGFLFTAPELASAAQLGLPLPVVVVDNGGYGEIRDEMARRGDPVHAVDLPSADLAALGRALGCRGVRVEPGGLAAALSEALAADRPTVVHVPARD
ncbi:5-guanidino-2-oxopentanoate decarboxylase [Saccharopolyspora rosea]|uniref:thiamine pyrophosphate-binding protein n=1 Tax=Saccharopolyspora rosea TaxID=524884 RepID=UPI0031E86816